ncbi:MAG: LOG family protein [Dehalococcoidia bacterium]
MTDKKTFSVEELVEAAREVLTDEGKDLRSLLYKEIITNGLKCRRDELDTLDLKIINRAISEFRHAARVFKPYRRIRKVSIFGSARVSENDPSYEMAMRLGRQIAEQGFMVITGAAEGIMKAGIEGGGPENSFGVNILLPSETGPARVIQDDPKLVKFKYFFARKIFFVMEADAFALFPGGFGTHDEGFETLTLLQTGKAPLMPLLLMELPGDDYWETWDRFVRKQLLERGFISPEDLSFYKIAHSPEEAIDWIKFYYSTYHSLRQVRGKLVIRLEKELPDSRIRELNERFRDVVESGEIVKTSLLPGEKDEPHLQSKPRITFTYNRKSAGRLNEMILAINEMGKSV